MMKAAVLEGIRQRFEELEAHLMDPQILADQALYLKKVKEHAQLQPLNEKIQAYQTAQQALTEDLALLEETGEADLRELLKQEIRELRDTLDQLEAEIQLLLLPTDPRDERDLFLEVRAGAGGEEAALFAEQLMNMYAAYCAQRGYGWSWIDRSDTELGGLKEGIVQISGQGAFSQFHFESGVHRVQRVPVTESGGRIHTSTVTVAVLPEVDTVSVEIDPKDLEIDTYRASGAGGQHVNKTDSAIRITHKPTGLVVTCQDQRSQHKNKDRAMAILRAKLQEKEEAEQSGHLAQTRRDQVGSGDRSERIRTYNFPQGRVTDHRIGLTLYQLEAVLAGGLDPIITPLIQASRGAQLAEGEAENTLSLGGKTQEEA